MISTAEHLGEKTPQRRSVIFYLGENSYKRYFKCKIALAFVLIKKKDAEITLNLRKL